MVSKNNKNFKYRGEEFNKEFVYLTDNSLRFREKEFQIQEGFQYLDSQRSFGGIEGKIVVMATQKVLSRLREKGLETVENEKGLYLVKTNSLRFVNFNKIADVSRIEQIRDKWQIQGSTDLELMENFIKFLIELGVSHQSLITKWLTGIQREIFYKDLKEEDLGFIKGKFNPMRSSTEEKRKFVYEYLKKHCEDSGILDTTVGEFQDVMSIDVSSMYPFIWIGFKFMVDDPYQYFYKGEKYKGKWDYLPLRFRRHIVKFYKKKQQGIKGKFYKLCLNCLSGKAISGYEVKKSNMDKYNFLCPQHGFQVIAIGRQVLEDMSQKLRDLDCRILERDTDSIKFQGDPEKVKRLLEEENKKIIKRLLDSGLTYQEAKCGIGQWKFEYLAEKFIQRSPKHYSYCVDGQWFHKGDRDETFHIYY